MTVEEPTVVEQTTAAPASPKKAIATPAAEEKERYALMHAFSRSSSHFNDCSITEPAAPAAAEQEATEEATAAETEAVIAKPAEEVAIVNTEVTEEATEEAAAAEDEEVVSEEEAEAPPAKPAKRGAPSTSKAAKRRKKAADSDEESEYEAEGDAEEGEDMAGLDTSNIIESGRRTRGKKIDFRAQLGDDTEEEEEEDEESDE